ncbi:hypothetical protein Aab01nite_06070 [Paractinoplanes abujensis]|uniref:Adhesin domain-containing protein n=1 Tax=Paractinoplanes abujensis TaxID=882441 RepID=A0A7W7CQR3_9ACTN|nr:DUF4097 family beta strand repeat-containing protein [Actinoplanes abujensis]MBB4691565.1 hypothetical protein [Actinoplanes abujensis]GID17017.1 hypothetical protein Aab01nite_06070 [Actinoplanes abujensis]
MNQFATPAPIAAVLTVPAGRVQFIAAERADTVVEVRPAQPGNSRDVRSAAETTVGFADGVLRVEAPADNKAGAVEVTVQLPAGSRVEGHSAAAELRGVGRLGDVVFTGAYRAIKVDEAASLRLTAVDGDVAVGRLTGPAEISTTRGAIRIDEAVRGTVILTSQDGDITIGAAAGAPATLDAGTSLGRVSSSLVNGGGAELCIRATTARGDITARSL